MTKELTPLEALENIMKLHSGSPIDLSQHYIAIKNALEELETKREGWFYFDLLANGYFKNSNFRNVFDQIVNEHKAFEIMKENQVIVYGIFNSNNYIEYNRDFAPYQSGYCLTKEEYDFLKEELE